MPKCGVIGSGDILGERMKNVSYPGPVKLSGLPTRPFNMVVHPFPADVIPTARQHSLPRWTFMMFRTYTTEIDINEGGRKPKTFMETFHVWRSPPLSPRHPVPQRQQVCISTLGQPVSPTPPLVAFKELRHRWLRIIF